MQIIILITALPLFDDNFDSPLVIAIAFVLVFLPLIIFIAMTLYLHKDDLKKFVKYFTFKVKSRTSNDATNYEIPMREFDHIIDDSMRQNATICYT